MVDAYRASPAKPLSLTAVRRVVAGDIGGVRPAASRALHGCYDALGSFPHHSPGTDYHFPLKLRKSGADILKRIVCHAAA
jgi:hypothetical protein